ncbi:MAG: hypothetical protein ACI86X_000674 [Moritella sp.]|jgi:hypothetical protein
MIGGDLTNSGQMPIDAGGGASGDSTATAKNSFGSNRGGTINMGGGGLTAQLPMLLLIFGVIYIVVKK